MSAVRACNDALYPNLDMNDSSGASTSMMGGNGSSAGTASTPLSLEATWAGTLWLLLLYGTATQAVHRIVDVFPGPQQEQIRLQLALSLQAVVCQQLLTRADGRGRVPAVEVLVATHAVRNHIRTGRIEQLYNELVVGPSDGMQSMERSLAGLVRAGSISADVAHPSPR